MPTEARKSVSNITVVETMPLNAKNQFKAVIEMKAMIVRVKHISIDLEKCAGYIKDSSLRS
jgi:ACT domain-containing protein